MIFLLEMVGGTFISATGYAFGGGVGLMVGVLIAMTIFKD